MTDQPTQEAITAVWRHESVRLVAALTRMTRDLDLAEDLAQDALVAALEQWPDGGVPANPGAWLMAVAKRRAIDQFRRNDTLRRRTAELAHDLEEAEMPDFDAAVDHIEDDVLRLAFLSCHPALPPESRTALTLRLVGGLTTQEIARAYLVKDATMGQRISRAKRLLAECGASFEMPTGAERQARLGDVMAVVYLIFNEGYAASSGAGRGPGPSCASRRCGWPASSAGWCRTTPRSTVSRRCSSSRARGCPPAATPTAGRCSSRTRTDGAGTSCSSAAGSPPWPRRERLGRAGRPVGTYVLQASIAACHARARRPEDTDWAEIARLYDVLAIAAPGPVVEVNRAVAHGRAHGADAGLAVLAAVDDDPALAGSHLLLAVRGDLLERAGRRDEAAAAFREAAALTRNDDERALLDRRADENG